MTKTWKFSKFLALLGNRRSPAMFAIATPRAKKVVQFPKVFHDCYNPDSQEVVRSYYVIDRPLMS